ncbi:GNAT family N-acetyltransferase [Streptomyces sp. bgisy084]|uniref:GNAT family N-acetyltransferase n=1 Tax=unclassified Streptomyces TaxID=2593676 RepID=UPI003D73940C
MELADQLAAAGGATHAPSLSDSSDMPAPEARGHGLGTQATRQTLDYAFRITNLRVVWLKVLVPNTAGIRAYEKAGCRPVGHLREAATPLNLIGRCQLIA